MIWDGCCTPLRSSGSSGMRNSGASYGSLVGRQTRMLACVSLNQSDWTITAGRGLPQSPSATTVTTSPRLICAGRYPRCRAARQRARLSGGPPCRQDDLGRLRLSRRPAAGHRRPGAGRGAGGGGAGVGRYRGRALRGRGDPATGVRSAGPAYARFAAGGQRSGRRAAQLGCSPTPLEYRSALDWARVAAKTSKLRNKFFLPSDNWLILVCIGRNWIIIGVTRPGEAVYRLDG